ncbi:sialoadhesin-like [Pelmatolapia mariae]|uniref:sialoadhesin-like n=1 Tax=Pelmatolapia mariae TaxID=158779 RepID=UPI002FE6557C
MEIRCSYTYPFRTDNPYIVVKTFWFMKDSNFVFVDLRTDSEYSGRVQYQCENKNCMVRITDLRESDSTEYKFRLITNQPGGRFFGSPGVTLTVADLQVQVSRSAVRGDSKSADLKCESSCPLPDNLSYIWYKNEQIITGQTSNLYLNHWDPTNRISCAVRGYENSRSPSVVVKDVWDVTYTTTQVCAFKGSSAEIRCTFRYPSTVDGTNTKVQKTFWFTKVKDNEPVDLTTESEYRDRVQYQCKNNDCTLRITDLRESDSAEYKFMFITNDPGGKYSGSPGVTLTVTDPQLQVHVRRSAVNSYSNWTELTCHHNCQLPDQSSYIWYRNGHKLSSDEQYFHMDTFDSTDSFHCAVKEHERFPSPTVYAPKLPSVSVSPSAEIVEGSSVTLTCSSDANPAANYTWYKEDVINPLSYQNQHVFSSILPSDSGKYYCTADNNLGQKRSESRTIDVKYSPRLPTVSVSPSGEIVEGSFVNLTCSSDANPAANYTWYKDKKVLSGGQQDVYHFSSISSEDSGNYFCKCRNLYGQANSMSLSIDVKYAPRLPTVSVSPSGEIVEGSSVNLTCSSDANPAANYTWYKENGHAHLRYLKQFTFTSIQSSDSGPYYCTTKNNIGTKISPHIFIDVKYAPRLPTVSVSPSGEIVEGISVNLTCSSDANPTANYTWYKDNKVLPAGTQDVYRFVSISSEDSGNYFCKCRNLYGQANSMSLSIDVKCKWSKASHCVNAPRLPTVSVSPSAEIVEGISVNLTCSSDANPTANYTWYKDNKVLPAGTQDVYRFVSISSEDSGNYFCKCRNLYGQANSMSLSIDVKYGPRLRTVSVSPSGEIVEGSFVNLTCSSDANPAANYTWSKDDKVLSGGQQDVYHFSSISSEDSGNYSCNSKNIYGQATSMTLHIDVQYAPRLPTVSVSPSGEIVEGSSVNLTCSSDANPAANYTWYKENGHAHLSYLKRFTFTSIQSSDSGPYYCTTKNNIGTKTSPHIFIDVKYAPRLPTVSVSPSAEIVEGISVNLTCSSDANPTANYTWYKDNKVLPAGTQDVYRFVSISSEDSGNYFCKCRNLYGQANSMSLSIDVKCKWSKASHCVSESLW